MSKDTSQKVTDIQAKDLRSDGMIVEGEEKKGPATVIDQVQASSDSVKAGENSTSQAPVPTPKGAPEAKQPITPEEADEAVKKAAAATSQAPAPAPKQTHSESLDALLKGETSLTEDFKAKAGNIFEEAVQSRVDVRVAQIEENFKQQLAEQTNTQIIAITEKVDAYLTYVVETWMKDNAVAIEKGLRTEIAEQFLGGLKQLFKESYITVPEGKEDQVDSLSKQVSSLEEQLSKVTNDNIVLVTEARNYKRQAILAEATKGLADTEVAKLNTLVENIAFDTEEDFKNRVTTIKENAIRKPSKMPVNLVEQPIETLNEEVVESNNSLVTAASSAITRMAKTK